MGKNQSLRTIRKNIVNSVCALAEETGTQLVHADVPLPHKAELQKFLDYLSNSEEEARKSNLVVKKQAPYLLVPTIFGYTG